jgi:hypothetical protein
VQGAPTLSPMSGVQLTFAIIGASLTLVALVWTVTWAIRSWRKAGAEVTAELGRGRVDQLGTLHVHFKDGRSKITRIEGDPWNRRKKAQVSAKPRAKRAASKAAGTQSSEAAKHAVPQWQDVNAIFVRNSGRTAITVTRCRYDVELNYGTVFQFEPQPSSCPWGDLLPKRVEAGHELILIHEKEEMRGMLNGVLRDHEVFQTIYGVYLELGDGTKVYAGPPILIQASMDDEEYAKVDKNLHRELYEGPEPDERLSFLTYLRGWRSRRWERKNVIMEDGLDEAELRALRKQSDSNG